MRSKYGLESMLAASARLLTLASSLLIASAASAQPSSPPSDETSAPEPANWRFRQSDKPVKVVVLAGSIGAFRGQSYAFHIGRMCSEVEVRNLSKTGFGAWQLRKRFAEQVVDNPGVRPRKDDGFEYWLVFGGGLNSIGAPLTTNHHIRRLFLLAHKHGFSVVGLTLTPWGDDADRRFRGVAGLDYRKATKLVSDFVLGRLKPRDALGNHASSRGDADAPWTAEELPDVAVDLYDSMLRDRDASMRDIAAMREALQKDRAWAREHAHLDEGTRALVFENDARVAAELPRWFMRPALRSFDHIHPNAEGHRIIADIMCPELPESWGCKCEGLDEPFEGRTDAAPASSRRDP